MTKIIVTILFLCILFIVGCVPEQTDTNNRVEVSEVQQEYVQDGQKYLIDPTQIRSGGPPPDGIPSIDEPLFVSLDSADEWIGEDELVMVLNYKEEVRVYPLQILVWHEIVNDVVAGEHLAITYCPLCGSGIAYQAYLNGSPVAFGTSGSLYNSNLLMYDRLSCGERGSVDISDPGCSLWTQIDGLAIKGDFIGTALVGVDIDTVVWDEWYSNNIGSGATVLSQETGHDRAYGQDPYGSYYEDSLLFFPVNGEDDTLHPKDVIFGITVNGQHIAYREVDLIEDGVIVHEVAGTIITLTRNRDGTVDIVDSAGDVVVKERDFWFAWYAFHPDTLLYE